MGLHIVLYQPEIPANTGNIARTCAGTNATLHLIRPLGFSTDDKMLKRAGCDYWGSVTIKYYDSINDLFDKYPSGHFYYIETVGKKNYTEFDYSDGAADHFFVFGRETTGLPKELLTENVDRCLRIPQTDKIRSLNLSNTAAILVYEALRQQGFPSLT